MVKTYLEAVEMEDKIINNLQVVCHQECQWYTEMWNKWIAFPMEQPWGSDNTTTVFLNLVK